MQVASFLRGFTLRKQTFARVAFTTLYLYNLKCSNRYFGAFEMFLYSCDSSDVGGYLRETIICQSYRFEQ